MVTFMCVLLQFSKKFVTMRAGQNFPWHSGQGQGPTVSCLPANSNQEATRPQLGLFCFLVIACLGWGSWARAAGSSHIVRIGGYKHGH